MYFFNSASGIKINKQFLVGFIVILAGAGCAGCSFGGEKRVIGEADEASALLRLQEQKFQQALSLYELQQFEAALLIFRELADEKYPAAEYYVGYIRETTGWLFKHQSKIRVGQWYERSAQGGYAPAQYRLGYFYHYGLHGSPESLEVAVYLYKAAAEQNNADALYALAELHYLGQWLKQDYQKAFAGMQPALQQGNVKAFYYVARMYELGQGVSQNNELAAQWYRAAAEKRLAAAHYYLGLMHQQGRGVSLDIATAYIHLELAKMFLKKQLFLKNQPSLKNQSFWKNQPLLKNPPLISNAQIAEQEIALEKKISIEQYELRTERINQWLSEHSE